MNKYAKLHEQLNINCTGTMKCFGTSMLPILSNPSVCVYQVEKEYCIGDIVFCKVKGRYIDAHKITKIADDGRYMISNNHGYDNGWTRQVFARVVSATDKTGKIIYTAPERKQKEKDE